MSGPSSGVGAEVGAGPASGPLSASDRFTRLLGLRLLGGGTAVDGEARVELVVKAEHTNAVGRLHGGALFSLADAAISRAAHRDGQPSVVTVAQMTFLRASFPGDRLVAHATEEHRGRRLGAYRAEIRCEGKLVATATGQSMPL